MKSLLLGLAGLLAMPLALADESCHLNLDQDILIEPNSITLTTHDGRQMQFNNRALMVDGEVASLSDEERATVAEYDAQLRVLVPEVVNLALEGVDVGITAMSEVFTALTGAPLTDGVAAIMEKFRNEVNMAVTRDGTTYHLNGERARGMEDLANTLEADIDAAVRDYVASAVTSMVGSILRGESSDNLENLNDFGTRMEKLGKEIETRVQGKVGNIEQRADALCVKAETLRETEDRLYHARPELAEFRIL